MTGCEQTRATQISERTKLCRTSGPKLADFHPLTYCNSARVTSKTKNSGPSRHSLVTGTLLVAYFIFSGRRLKYLSFFHLFRLAVENSGKHVFRELLSRNFLTCTVSSNWM
jgi:hypothetical protein